ncbi:MAG: DNA polymerase Y family protein [Gammaproteobacteria bacterium]|nr:DNA polymerase Y family protein [Gammaproteobacteria bacterium]
MPSSPGQRWLCLRFTHLALNSAGISLSSDQPSAITDNQQIWQCNARALKTGVKPGISANHALMLDPALTLLERDPAGEAKRLQELSFWAYRFSSLISLYNEQCLLVEIGRSVKLFNGLDHLLHLINNDLTSFQMAFQPGIARTPKAAHLLSFNTAPANVKEPCSDQERLAQCPVGELDIDQRVISKLHNCGFEVLADIQAIPPAELGQRFGVPLLNYLQQLNGDKADPQSNITPPETFHGSIDFAEPISNLQWIEQQLDRLLNDLHNFITQRQLVCRSFTWRFFNDNPSRGQDKSQNGSGSVQTVTIGLSASQNKLTTLRELTGLKLASLELQWEFSGIELSSTQLVPLQLFNNDLFDPQPDRQRFNQLLDKLVTRLGDQALFRPHIETEHLPELVNGRQHVAESSATPYHASSPADKKRLDQPLWLLEQPQRLAQQQHRPVYEGPLNLIHGPDRISSHWWARLQSRDYFIARQRSGRLLWVYFDRCNRHWYLHGLFA